MVRNQNASSVLPFHRLPVFLENLVRRPSVKFLGGQKTGKVMKSERFEKLQPVHSGRLRWQAGKSPFRIGNTGVIKLPILGKSNNANVWDFLGISLIIVHCLGW